MATSRGKKSAKPVSKDDLRRLMKEKKYSAKAGTKRIDSPLAKYNTLGQLICVVCTSQVKSELLWNAHIQGRSHKENVAALKAQNDAKKTASVALPPGISKNQQSTQGLAISKQTQENTGKSKRLPDDFFDNKVEAKKVKLGIGDYSSSDEDDDDGDELTKAPAPAPIPAPSTAPGLSTDFFDAGVVPSASKAALEETKVTQSMAEKLPEGFFDDPKQDAKVRQVEYRDKMEDEWEMFQRAMKEETIKSEAIQEEDDEAIINERNIEEIDDQLHRWTKVDSLAKVKEEIMTKETESKKEEEEEAFIDDAGSDDDADRLDWRIQDT